MDVAMMSREAHLGDSQGHWHPHLMFYGPRSDGADWRSDLPGSPVMLNPQFQTDEKFATGNDDSLMSEPNRLTRLQDALIAGIMKAWQSRLTSVMFPRKSATN
jgi:hypothetical protein